MRRETHQSRSTEYQTVEVLATFRTSNWALSIIDNRPDASGVRLMVLDRGQGRVVLSEWRAEKSSASFRELRHPCDCSGVVQRTQRGNKHRPVHKSPIAVAEK